LRAVVRDVAGSIEGTVTAPEGVDVEGLQVTATRVGNPTPDATTAVDAANKFLLPFLAPGTYNVTVVAPTGHSANSVEVAVGEDQDVTGVALVITAN
jgi:hypothetical protein